MNLSDYTVLRFAEANWFRYTFFVFLLIFVIACWLFKMKGHSFPSTNKKVLSLKELTVFTLCFGVFLFVFDNGFNRVYVFNEREVLVFDSLFGTNLSESNLVESAQLSELYPYFHRTGYKKSRTYHLCLKSNSHESVGCFKSSSIKTLAKRYAKLHERHPSLTERLQGESGLYFEKFKRRLNRLL